MVTDNKEKEKEEKNITKLQSGIGVRNNERRNLKE